MEDAEGSLWFATQEGLARYDGSSLRTYRAAPAPGGLSSSYVTALAVSPYGSQWVDT